MTTTPPPPVPAADGASQRPPWLVPLLAVLGVAVVGALVWLLVTTLGDDDAAAPVESPTVTASPSPSPTVPETPLPTASPTATASPTSSPALPDAGLGPFTGGTTIGGENRSWLADVRAAENEGYDRVVFEFTGDVPSYVVEYADPPFVAISGMEVPVEGAAFIQVRLEGTSAFNLDEGEPVYEGPQRIDPGTDVVTEVVNVEDFEAVVIWVIGVEEQQPMRVFTLEEPGRLVIDVLDD